MSELIEGISHLPKSECVTLLKKIIKRIEKEEKPKEYKGRRSNSYCGDGRSPRGKIKGNSTECVRKGFGAGSAVGVIKGVNKERESLYRMIKRNI
jgi:hypothetical protein